MSAGIGLWQFAAMPFGLCKVPATFERLIEQVLSGLPTTIAPLYLDDILVPGRTFNQQIENLRTVFNSEVESRKTEVESKEMHSVSKAGVVPRSCCECPWTCT